LPNEDEPSYFTLPPPPPPLPSVATAVITHVEINEETISTTNGMNSIKTVEKDTIYY
jgi:hypothetical protein